jgi:hypothetical protein
MEEDVLKEAPPTGALFETGTEVQRLVEALAAVYHRLDADLNRMRQDRYIETASNKELDKRARPLGVERPPGESDEAFRQRAKAGRERVKSTTTFESFADAALATLDAEPDEIEIYKNFGDELGAVFVEATSDVYDEAPLSEPTIIKLLEDSLPMDRRVILRRRDGFQFSVDSTADGKGFGQGQWTE